jgi:predicted RNA methylase
MNHYVCEKCGETFQQKNSYSNHITSSCISTTQTIGLKRNTIDKYYTKSDVVELCLNMIKPHIQINENDLIIEPSAGNGAFISGIKSITNNYVFYDIAPEHNEIVQCDYLLCDTSNFNIYEKIHVIGNPPFGRQSSSAIKFIKKSCEFCHSISFILPKSFKKDSLKNSFHLNFHLVCEIDLPNKSFLVGEIEYDVPCVFQIWEKKNHGRIVAEKLEPKGFIFVDKTENPDISFRRVGVNAGKIDTNIHEKSIQSHYFIKFTNNKPVHENIHKLSTIAYVSDNTVGPKSISKQELIKEFIKVL